MSIHGFVQGGDHRGFLGTKDGSAAYGCPWEIKIYDIGEDTVVGAEYPDGARQAQPLTWQSADIRRALEEAHAAKRERPTLKKRPTLKRRKPMK